MLHERSWPSWDASSGEFWDLFWAGCYRFEGPKFYGDRALSLTDTKTPVRWSPAKSRELIADIESRVDGTRGEWRFHGPMELVVVGARREGPEIAIDWESLRSIPLYPETLGTLTAFYTEAHIRLDPEVLGECPAPGDFSDDLPPRQVLLAMAKKGPSLLRMLGIGG